MIPDYSPSLHLHTSYGLSAMLNEGGVAVVNDLSAVDNNPAGLAVTKEFSLNAGLDSDSAIRTTLGRRVVHRTSAFKNNGLEQDHRGVKGRIRCMRGFKSFASAERFCRSHDELRNFLRLRTRHNQHVPADRRRLLYLRRANRVLAILAAA